METNNIVCGTLYNSSILKHPSDHLIHINSCGELKLTTDSHIIRVNGREDYLLIYIYKGSCYFSANGKSYTANAGDVVLYHPNEPQDYCFLGKDNPHNFWFHFSGVDCEKLFNDFGLNNIHLVSLSNNCDLEYLFTMICKHFLLKTSKYQFICSGLMTTALALVGNSLDNNADSLNNSSGNKHIRLVSEVISRFNMAPELYMNVSDCARFCKMSTSYFNRVFKNVTGMAPQQYFINMRIERAKNLLAFTDKNIFEITIDIGFKDQNYFSRIFKKKEGVTPSEYRKKIQK